MSNEAALSKAGSRAVLEVALEGVDTQKPLSLDQWALVVLVGHLGDLAVSEVASEVASMVAEVVADSGEASKNVEATAVEGEALATKAVEVFPEEVMEEEIEAQMDTERPQMHQPDQVAHAPAAPVVVASTEAGLEALAPRTATVLVGQVVGMTRVVAVAHMMTDPADTAPAAIEVMGTATHLAVEAVAIRSR
jgi:hypothetical protein